MAAPYSAIESKAEEAVQSVIRTAATGIADAQVFTSFQSGFADVIGTHSVSIICEGGIEDGYMTGNFRVNVRVQVASNIDQDVTDEGSAEVATHREYAGKVFDAISVDSVTLAASLSAAVSDFYVYNSIAITHGRHRVDNRKAISEMLLEFTCIPQDAA